MKIITTSWDDGHPLDLQLSELLCKYKIKGTFYIPKLNPENPVMSCFEIRTLAQGFEIGGHTYGHTTLTSLSQDKAREEILNGKKYIDDLLGVNSKGLCAPGGHYNRKIISEAIKCEYTFIRTTTLFQTKCVSKNIMHTTLQMYPHSKFTYLKHCLKRSLMPVLLFNRFFLKENNLLSLAEEYLEKIDKHGGIFHLWGHSWEIQNNKRRA